MKAAKLYTEQWEESNLQLLLQLLKQFNEIFIKILKISVKFLNLVLFINYQVAKALWLFVKLLFLTEPAIKRIEKDETWIFRQIK